MCANAEESCGSYTAQNQATLTHFVIRTLHFEQPSHTLKRKVVARLRVVFESRYLAAAVMTRIQF